MKNLHNIVLCHLCQKHVMFFGISNRLYEQFWYVSLPVIIWIWITDAAFKKSMIYSGHRFIVFFDVLYVYLFRFKLTQTCYTEFHTGVCNLFWVRDLGRSVFLIRTYWPINYICSGFQFAWSEKWKRFPCGTLANFSPDWLNFENGHAFNSVARLCLPLFFPLF